jgi:hypothetical protein
LQIFLLPKNLKRNAERPKGVFELKKSTKIGVFAAQSYVTFRFSFLGIIRNIVNLWFYQKNIAKKISKNECERDSRAEKRA